CGLGGQRVWAGSRSEMLERANTMKCLNCSAEMMNNLVQTRDDRISYDMCEACGSLWLDAGELDKMAFQVEGSIEYCSRDKVAGSRGPGKNCPRCDDTALDPVSFIGSDIVLDRCKNCGGFWLDGGELDLVNRELEAKLVNNVHLPYWYKRVRRKSSETDFKVDVPPIKGAERESATECTCPACGATLDLYTVFGIKVEACSKCKGILLDRNELRSLKDKTSKGSWQTLRWMDDEVEAIDKTKAMPARRLCPRCEGTKMVCAGFGDSKVIIDWCPKCQGVWLDRDEFQEIMQYLREKLDKISSAEMRSKVLEEIKEIWTGHEGKISEILDAKAAISALLNITIFEHPSLYRFLAAFSAATPIR
ncbi:MAG: TFIIB-type zinc ribbon-containing protein, partial [Planctomycetota bacterium]